MRLGETSILVEPHSIVEACRVLRDECGYNFLRDVTAVDFQVEPRFQVVYHLLRLSVPPVEASAEAPVELRLKAPVPGDQPVLPSVVSVFPTANWHEREVFDLFGIEFSGHPDLGRILMPDTWEGYPLRKDYPITYEEVAFTFNQDDIAAHKPRAEA
jgi:NADH-quinone oxidoreductase subunit C